MTTSQVAPAPVAPGRERRRPRGVLRVLLAFVVFVLGLGLTFGTGGVAHADLLTKATPVVVKAATRAAPMAATANPAGLTAAAVTFLGILAWETKDSWMPVIGDWLNPPTGQSDVAPGAYYTSANAYATLLAEKIVPTGGGYLVTLDANIKRVYYPDYIPTINYQRVESCRNASGGIHTTTNGPAAQQTPLAQLGDYNKDWNNSQAKSISLFVPTGCDTANGFSPFSISLTPMNNQNWNTLSQLSASHPISDADFYQESEVRCRMPDGTTVTLTDGQKGHPGRIAVPSCLALYPDSIPEHVTVKGGPEGGPLRDLITITTPQDVFDEYADCFGPSGLVCDIRVFVDGQPCNFGDALCERWKEVRQSQPQRVECRFGSYVVPIAQCEPLKRAYVDVSPVTVTDPAGNPGQETDPDVKVPEPEQPNPTEGPNPEIDPEIKTPDPVDPDGSTPREGSSCWGTGWSWNPVSWVVVPLKCVFIPSEGIGSRADRLKDRYKGRAPFAFLAPVVGMAYGVGSECPNWRIKVLPGTAAYDANVVCDSSFTQAIRNARPFLVAGGIALAFWPLVRGVLYASVPIVKPTPTDGK